MSKKLALRRAGKTKMSSLILNLNFIFLYKGLFNNYVDKMRWVGGPKMST